MSDNSATVYHEVVKVPLFPVEYNVFVSTDVHSMLDHAEEMFKGIKLFAKKDTPGFTTMMTLLDGSQAIAVFINTTVNDELPSLIRRVVHQAVHLSWAVLETEDIEVDEDNHEVQSILVEEFVEQLMRVVNEGKKVAKDDTLGEL